MVQARSRSKVSERFVEIIPALAGCRFRATVTPGSDSRSSASLAEEDLRWLVWGGPCRCAGHPEESGRPPIPAGYGVWAARSGNGGVTAAPVAGGWILEGRKPFCSGSGVLDRALITARHPTGTDCSTLRWPIPWSTRSQIRGRRSEWPIHTARR